MNGSRPRPVIGLTTYLQQAKSGIWDVHAAFLSDRYIHGVNRSGGIATLLPPQPVDDDIADRILARVDGLILTGGRDVDPAAYAHEPHPTTDEPDTARDTWEFALVAAALRRHLPVLGICRGAQVLNVALGGTLHQHLPDVVGHTHHQQGNAVFATSSIKTVEGSKLAGLLGERANAQCYHHQAIDRLCDGLVITGLDEDGVIGAVEMPGHDFVLAVQWHPEETLEDLRLFAGLVEAARAYTTERVN